ncbi:MAG: hypothetical protein AAB500_00365 [Patescibacteria group bacterium]
MMTEEREKEAPIIKTFTTDLSAAIEESHGTLVKKIIEEEEARESEPKHLKGKGNRIYGFFGSLFLILGVSIIFYFVSNSHVPPPRDIVPSQGTQWLLSVNGETQVSISGLSKDEIVAAILAEEEKLNVRPGWILAIKPATDGVPVGLRHFVALAALNLPLDNIENVSDEFLLGVFGEKEGGKSLFFLLQAREFQDIFPGMRVWEKKMFSDIYRYFRIPVSLEFESLQGKNFEDGLVENKNARLLYAPDGRPVMFYLFADERSVLLGSSPAAAREVVLRLTGSGIRK